MDPARRSTATRWGEVRAAVRRRVAAHLSADHAERLLPPAPGEPHEPDPDGAVAAAVRAAADFRTLALDYPNLLEGAQRKRHGAWYTPADLVEPTVARTLAPLLASAGGKSTHLRICDPAAGGGTFLLAALRWLRRQGFSADAALCCLSGLDIDATAAVLAALALGEECGAAAPDPLAVAARVRHGDGLRELADGGFDAVLTNPPWETLQADAEARANIAALRPRFRHQGAGKLYTYRLFVERAHALLRDGGRFGLVVPASLWFDRDAGPLRDLLVEHSEWEWLYGFENRRRLFAIDSRYRFAVVVGRKGGRTTAIRAAFARTDPAEWAAAEPRHVVYPTRLLGALSPRHRTFVEVEDERDLTILAHMAGNGDPLTGEGGALDWRQGDFNMTSDRDRFVLRGAAEADGYRPTPVGTWRRGDDELLPLYQGAMVYDLHPNTGAHRHGTGHATTWERPPRDDELRPLYLVAAAPWRATAATRPPARVALRALSNATNERTAVACLLPDVPCGNSLGVLTPRLPEPMPLRTMAAVAAVLGSLPFDWALRRRLTGTNLNGFVLTDCMLPRLEPATSTALARIALQLCAVLPWHDALWRAAAAEGWGDGKVAPARDPERRRRLLTDIDALVGRAFGLQRADVARMVTDDGPRGFRRVDRDLPPAQRRPQRWLERVHAAG